MQVSKPDPGDHPDALIPVEKIGGPVLAVCGQADTLWESSPYAEAIMGRLDATGFTHPHEVYAYPRWGTSSTCWYPDQPWRTDLYADGVSPQLDELGRIDVWPKVLQAITTS